MLKDPMLEWTKRFITTWILLNKDSFLVYVNTLPLTRTQSKIIKLRYLDAKSFKEIEFALQISHNTATIEHQKALKIILDYLTRLI